MAKDKVQIQFTGSEEYRHSLQQAALGRKMKVQELLEAAVRNYLAGGSEDRASGVDRAKESKRTLIQTKPSEEVGDRATLSPTEPYEWASLAAVASHVTGRIERSMYRSIRFQLEYLALVAQQQGIHAPPITIRYDDDGNLVVPVSDPSSPLHPPDRVEAPRRTGVGPVREEPRPKAYPVSKRRKAIGE